MCRDKGDLLDETGYQDADLALTRLLPHIKRLPISFPLLLKNLELPRFAQWMG